MNGTVPQKIGRVVGDLLLHPQYISRVMSHNLIQGKTPLDLEIPWFSYAAIDFLKEFVQSDMTVFEYGSGGSTLFFAERAKSVVSVEDNERWFDMVSKRLQQKSIRNALLKFQPFDFRNPKGFEQSAYLNAIPDGPLDIVVIDGSEEWTQVRPICFEKAEAHVREGGIIVLDDSWRYPGLRQNNRARSHRIFQSVGPCRPGVTSTDVFFY